MKAYQNIMQKSNYEVEVLVNGKPLKEYIHKGRIYVEGREGTTFSLRLRNNSYQRKLFIPSIDGLSVMNGEDASFDSSGYIVEAYSSITIDGWRISDADVAQFYFSAPNDSYRKRMKKGNNLGVIGCAVFDEKEKPRPIVIKEYIREKEYVPYPIYPKPYPHWPHDRIWLCNTQGMTAGASMNTSNSVNMMATATSGSQDLGTGWGESKKSEVVSVEFERASTPATTLEIYYNTREQLETMGVDFRKAPLYIAPQAFPGQYCRPPRQ